MSRQLIKIIDEHRERVGQPSEASIARALGVTPQAVSAWRKQSARLPAATTLRKLAALTHVPYEEVLRASLVDAGYLTKDEQ